MLALAYIRNSQSTINFSRHEQAGVSVIKRIEPWLIKVQKQRRLVLSGVGAKLDMNAIDTLLAPVKELAASVPDGLDVRPELAKVEQLHQAMAAQATSASPDDVEGAM